MITLTTIWTLIAVCNAQFGYGTCQKYSETRIIVNTNKLPKHIKKKVLKQRKGHKGKILISKYRAQKIYNHYK